MMTFGAPVHNSKYKVHVLTSLILSKCSSDTNHKFEL